MNSAFGIDHGDGIEKRYFSDKRRKKLAAKGSALPGGKLPITSHEDFVNAERLKNKVKGIPPAEVDSYLAAKEKKYG